MSGVVTEPEGPCPERGDCPGGGANVQRLQPSQAAAVVIVTEARH